MHPGRVHNIITQEHSRSSCIGGRSSHSHPSMRSMPTFKTHGTPNPNSLKITTDTGPFIAGGLESFSTAHEAQSHPLGRALFSVDGVENVLILPAFVTVTKAPDADWNALLPAVEEALAAHLSD